MTSTRLPGKVLKKVLGKSLIEYELERLQSVSLLDELIVATTKNESDDPIVDLCEKLGVETYRGPEHDVLLRFYEAAKCFGADIVIRFTADCPLLDPGIVADIIRTYLDNCNRLDYLGVDHTSIPRGMEAEAFSFEALERANAEGAGDLDREHVTWFMHQNPDRFSISKYALPQKLGTYRFTVDTEEDFSLVSKILEELYENNPYFSLQDTIALLDQKPEIRMINAGIQQKKYI